MGEGHFLPALPDKDPQRKRGIAGKDDIVICPDGILLIPILPVVQPVKIINELKGKELCIHNLLDKKGSSFVQDLMAKFKGTSEFDIKIVSKEKVFSQRLNSFVNGLTNPIKAGKIEIFISTTNADKNSALEVARTLIHEYIHADMLRKLNTIEPSIVDLNFRQTYEAYQSKIFKATAQHNSMADLYIKSFKATLKEFHRTALASDYDFLSNSGRKSLDDFYEALAWKGIKEDGVVAWSAVPELRKRALEAALQESFFVATKTCPN